MTLSEKIDRFLSETRKQRVGGWTAAPPLIRLLWLFRIDVPPPLYWPPWVIALVYGIMFWVGYVLLLVFVFDESWHQVPNSWIAAVIFGLGMAWYSRRQSRRFRLSLWSGPKVGDA